jgi:ABC-type transport system substrate-binding protein
VKTLNLKKIYKSFSLTEKAIFSVFFVIFIISVLAIIINLNQKFLVEIPVKGGTLTEGVVGTPRLINPLVAVSETDRGLVKLVYAGLLKDTGSELVADIAERYEVSEDGLVYRFFIKEDAEFHDGEPVTSDDIIFTILAAQNPELSSPKRSNWEGVSLEKNKRQRNSF